MTATSQNRTTADPTSTKARTFAFVDLAGFTALTEAHGDEAAVAQVERFVELTRQSIRARGRLVKCLGDAVMLCFESPGACLEAVENLLDACQRGEGLPLPRTGIHHGPAIERDGDWFGATVNLAARVAAQAQGGQTLATSAIADVARAQAVPIVELGCFSLRNIAQPVELFELELVPPTEAVSIDPVCRMQVHHGSAAGRLRHLDRDHWFCSFECVQAFTAAPEQY
ncbi:MAG: adenylate/guanylate cyclase domain-containing protein [Acidimicrobiales bacterium]